MISITVFKTLRIFRHLYDSGPWRGLSKGRGLGNDQYASDKFQHILNYGRMKEHDGKKILASK